MLFSTTHKKVMSSLIDSIINFFNDSLFIQGFQNVFFIENVIGAEEVVENIRLLVFGFASLLLTLKLLHKLFNIYIIGVDGDNTVSPIEYFKSYFKGIIVTSTFTVAYGWIWSIITEFTEKALSTINSADWRYPETAGLGLPAILMIVYCIFIVILYINFMTNGVRMLFLRLALPFACVGLIDNDNGIYSVFIKKLLQTGFTVCVQVILAQLSLLPIKEQNALAIIPSVVGIAVLSYSLKITTDLNEIFLVGAASGAGQKISALGRGIQSIASFRRK